MQNEPNNPTTDTGLNINLDYKKLIRDILMYWWLFAITIPIALGGVYLRHRWVTDIYSASMRILMEERGNEMPQTDMMEGFGLTPGMRNLDNQLAVLTSWDIVRSAVDALDFDVSYFVKGNFKTSEIYPANDYKVEFDTLHPQLLNTPFYIKKLDGNSFELKYNNEGQGAYNYNKHTSCSGPNFVEVKKQYELGQWITTDWFRFRILSNNLTLPDENLYYFVFNHPNTITGKYSSFLRASKNGESSIIRLSVTGANRSKNVKFLDTLAKVFISSNLEKKNQIATNTIRFIESQLINIRDSLSNTGAELSNFRTSNRIQSISSKAEYLFTQLQESEQKLAELYIMQNYYDYLIGYFNNDQIDNDIIAPAIYKLENQLLSTQIQKIIDLNSERLAVQIPLGKTTINPLSEQKDMELKLAKDVLIKTIESQTHSLDREVSRIKSEKDKFEADLYGLPETERKLLGIERKFDLNNEVFTFLLRKRSEAQIQKASNTPDHHVLEAARSGGRVSSSMQSNLQKSFIFALLIPLFLLVVRQLLNNRITSVEDVEKISSLPIMGQVIHSDKKEVNVVSSHPRSVVTETFRRVRTRLEFLFGEKKSPIITVTSSMPGEGKTFCSLNLASAFALAGKKTVIIGFDMRKPGLNKVLNLNDYKGVSNFLIGKASLEEIILPAPSGLENLYVIPSGVIPPNPSELIGSKKTKELFEMLRNQFDIILLDSPPMGVVADPYLLARHSDALIFLVRHNHTIRQVFAHTVSNLKAEGITTNVGILLNDLNVKQGGYGSHYGYGYGYGYGQGYYEE